MPLRIFLLFIFTTISATGAIDAQQSVQNDYLKKIPRDVRVGVRVALSMVNKFGVVQDKKLVKRMLDISYRVAAASGQSKTHFVFNILDISDPNAVALPGGFIFITKGLLDLDLTDNEIAHVIAHECSHVIREHHKRIQKSATLINLINTAVLAGAIFAAQNTSSNRSTANLGVDRRTASPSGRAQQIMSAAVLSGLASNLFLLKYIREYEIEADRTGRALATGAGFSPEGSADMLQKLLSRSYQRPGMGILRTHPYLEDRITLANQESIGMSPNPDPRKAMAYRNEVQAILFYQANEYRAIGQWAEAEFLLKSSYTASPEGSLADDAHVQELLWREAKQKEDAFLNRDWGFFCHAYEKLLEDFPNTDLKNKIHKRLEYFRKQRAFFYSKHLKKLEQEEIIPTFGEYFLRNYPDDSRIPEAKTKLAVAYRKGRKYDKSAKLLLSLLDENALNKNVLKGWLPKAHTSFALLLPKLTQIDLAYRYYQTLNDSRKRKKVSKNILEIIIKSKDFEMLGLFREEYPKSLFEKELIEKLNELAQTTLARARFHRRTRNYSESAFEYYKVNRYSPDRELAEVASQEIKEMQELE